MTMLTALVLSGFLMNEPVVHPGVHLLAQADRQVAQSPDELRARLGEIDLQLHRLSTDWPASAIVLVAVGGVAELLGLSFSFIALYVALVVNPIYLVLIPLLLAPGIVMIVIGASIGSASVSANSKRRSELLKQRALLDEQLQGTPQRGPTESRPVPTQVMNEVPPVLLTVAEF